MILNNNLLILTLILPNIIIKKNGSSIYMFLNCLYNCRVLTYCISLYIGGQVLNRYFPIMQDLNPGKILVVLCTYSIVAAGQLWQKP